MSPIQPSPAVETIGATIRVVTVAAVVAAACGGAAPEPGVSVQDSAGVRVVEVTPAAIPASGELRVDPEPEATIGSLNGPESQQLFRVADAVRLPDGRLAVVNRGTSELRIYDDAGEHLRTVGGSGAGPGEFRSPDWVALRADTLIVFDPLQDGGRFSYFTTDGDLLATEPLRVAGLSFATPDAVLPDGTLLDEVSEGSIGPTEVGHVRLTRMPVRYPRSGSRVDTLVTAAGSERFREESAGRIAAWPVPFGNVAYTAIAPDHFFLGNGDTFTIDGYEFDGAHRLSIRVAHEPTPVTDALVDRWIDATLSGSNLDVAERARRRFGETPVPETMPAHADLQADAAGRLWVRRYSPPWETANAWYVFDVDGLPLGSVELPAGLDVIEIGENHLLGLRTDELDVEYLQVHGIEAAAG